ncbi:hypothetical protein Btru_026851 [Bulinus truncatus]|nr:hypothetical protein Btru_026851 [Bulinus truncatus]
MYIQVHLKPNILALTLLLTSLTASAQNEKLECDPDIPSRLSPPSTQNKPTRTRPEKSCGEGEYMDGFKCTPCDTGTFRTQKMAQDSPASKCEQCLTPIQYEVVAQFCNATRDTFLLCEFGFYRYQVPENPCNSRCIRCSVCGVGTAMFNNFEVRKCNEYQDTVCCLDANMNVLHGQCVSKVTTTALPFTTSAAMTTTDEVLTSSLNVTINTTSSVRSVKSGVAEAFVQEDFALLFTLATAVLFF